MQDFLESKYYSEYKRGAVFGVQQNQVSPLVTKMRSEAASKYVLLANNCSHACGQSMSSVGLDPGYIKSGPIRDRWGQVSEQWIMSPIPNIQYQQMIINNSSRLVMTVGK
ncbi:MAG: hypothetical protein JWM14_233 [Chitinophagaceae bacterium]|nr:hypothetical protein [Chitinophagaceae bacterium]